MRGTVLYGPRDIRFEERETPGIVEPTDAVIRMAVTCVCGSDLWPYRGLQPTDGPTPMGHESCGVVEEVGGAVRSVKPGQFVIGSFATSDNTCPHCQYGYQSSCIHREFMTRAQAPLLRVPLADGTLVPTPDAPSDDLFPSLLALSDVMGTMSRHPSRQKLAREFGATDIVTERGDEGVARIKDLTKGADAVLECVGTQDAMMQAIRAARPGGSVGCVGVPHGVALDGQQLFFTHVRLHGGPAPVRRYLPHLIDLVWKGTINPGKVFDLTLPRSRWRRLTVPWTSDVRSRRCSVRRSHLRFMRAQRRRARR